MMKKVKKYIDYVLSLVSKAIERKIPNENSTLNICFIHVKNSKEYGGCVQCMYQSRNSSKV